MQLANTACNTHEVESTALAMKKCGVVLCHRALVNLKENTHEHKIRMDVHMEGTKEQLESMKWQLQHLTDKDN